MHIPIFMATLVSIIIVNYNGKEYLENCLKLLRYCKYSPFEIIVVDNGSVDDSLYFISNKFPDVQIIKLKQNIGFAKANNLAAKAANGDLLLFLNNDTLPTPDFLNELVEPLLKNNNVVICQSLLLRNDLQVDSAGDFLDVFGCAFSSHTIPSITSPILSAKGASMLMNKKIFFSLGMFDEHFFASFEDVDLGWRACIYGYDVLIVPKSIVYHLGSKTISKIHEQIWFHVIKNSIIIRIINFETIKSIKPLFFLFSLSFLRKITRKKIIPDSTARSPSYIPTYGTIFKSLFWVICNWKYVRTRKNIIKLYRKRSTVDLINSGLIRSMDTN